MFIYTYASIGRWFTNICSHDDKISTNRKIRLPLIQYEKNKLKSLAINERFSLDYNYNYDNATYCQVVKEIL